MSETAYPLPVKPLPPLQLDSSLPPCEIEQTGLRVQRCDAASPYEQDSLLGNFSLDRDPGAFILDVDPSSDGDQWLCTLQLATLEMLYSQ